MQIGFYRYQIWKMQILLKNLNVWATEVENNNNFFS